jgi:exo-beta-1,3-glucanase (GH17 family)
VDLAVVGDETLSGSGLSESKLIQYMNKVKTTGVPTTTSQTYDELLAHPRVVAACNVVVMNVYPIWDRNGTLKPRMNAGLCVR